MGILSTGSAIDSNGEAQGIAQSIQAIEDTFDNHAPGDYSSLLVPEGESVAAAIEKEQERRDQISRLIDTLKNDLSEKEGEEGTHALTAEAAFVLSGAAIVFLANQEDSLFYRWRRNQKQNWIQLKSRTKDAFQRT